MQREIGFEWQLHSLFPFICTISSFGLLLYSFKWKQACLWNCIVYPSGGKNLQIKGRWEITWVLQWKELFLQYFVNHFYPYLLGDTCLYEMCAEPCKCLSFGELWVITITILHKFATPPPLKSINLMRFANSVFIWVKIYKCLESNRVGL